MADSRSHTTISEVLDETLVRLKAGESVETCLADYPQFASELAALLHIHALIDAHVTMPLPPALEEWLSTSTCSFEALAQQLLACQMDMGGRSVAEEVALGSSGSPLQAASQPVDRALDQAIAMLRAGTSLDECLAEYPQLAPLVRIGALLAEQANSGLSPDLESWLSAGKRDFSALVQQLSPRSPIRRRSPVDRLLGWRWVIATVMTVVFLFYVVDGASAQSIPGQPLYAWKRTREDLTISFVYDSSMRGYLHANYAQRRLDEFNTMVEVGEKDPALIAETLDNLLDHLQRVAEDPSGGKPEMNRLLNLTEQALGHAEVLAPKAMPVLYAAQAQVDELERQVPLSHLADPSATPQLRTTGPSDQRDLSLATPAATFLPHLTATDVTTSALELSTPTPTILSRSPVPLSPTPSPLVPTAAVEPSLTVMPSLTPISVPTSTRESSQTPTVEPATATLALPLPQPTNEPSNTPSPSLEAATVPPSPAPQQTLVPTETALPTEAALPTETSTSVVSPTESTVPIDSVLEARTVNPTTTAQPEIVPPEIPTMMLLPPAVDDTPTVQPE